jgi:hypothetical protein
MNRRTRSPALAALAPLVGEWEMEAASVDGRPLARGRTTFEWLEGGAFLLQRADAEATDDTWRDHTPFPVTSIIGVDDSSGEFAMLYADSRDVFRIYRMTVTDRAWRLWRDDPGFLQRFIGEFTDDRRTITGRWEQSADGTSWERDFDMTYRRLD